MREQFLAGVQSYIEKDPEAAAFVADYVQAGLHKALAEANERACDMEVALCLAVSRKYKNSEEVVFGKLKKWEGKTTINWQWLTDK